MDKEQKKWMFILVILILILLNVAVFINEIKLIRGEEKTAENSNQITENEVNETRVEYEKHVKDQEENIRIQHYVAEFLGMLENQKYQQAYDLLNDDFKNGNMQTLDKFIEFCKIYPSKNTTCAYSNFDRIGSSLYVITVTINQLTETTYKPIKQTFVVRENDYNNYTISLQMDYQQLENE